MSNLKIKAAKNVSLIRNKSKNDTKEVKGTPLNHSEKHTTLLTSGVMDNKRIVGINIGTTLNMGDYESLRIDCWLTDFVGPDETHEDAFRRVQDIASRQIIKTAESMK